MRTRLIAALAALALVAVGCTSGEGSGGPLEGTDWVLRAYDVDGTLTLVPDNLYADAEFASNRVRGFSGCNDFDALYRAGGRTLFISQPAVTLRACEDEANAFEQAVLAALDASRFYTSKRQTLTVYGEGRAELLVYDAAPRNPLRGEWQVTAFNNGQDAVTSPIAGTEIDVTFGLLSVGGFAGCNSFSGTYGTNGNIARVGPLATTRLACDQEIMDQEQVFLDALQGVALIEPRGKEVNLTTLRGAIMVTLVRPEEEGLASPQPSREPTTEPTSEPTEEASPTPEPTPTPSPSPTPTPEPSAPPDASPTPPPAASATPRPSVPPINPSVATCRLTPSGGSAVAEISYAGAWHTLTEPTELACRYFDPDPITVPSDPATLVTAVMASTSSDSYADAVAAATDADSWDVRQSAELTVDGLPATLVEAVATSDDAGVPSGMSRFAYFIDVGAAGTVSLFTTATTVDEAYATRAGIVTLMTEASTFLSS